MSNLPKCRRVKRPTILVKRSQLAKKNKFNKRSYKPLYEKVKGNNNALAKALSKEKQESQYLFSQNLALTSEVQELGVACNKRDDIISGVMTNAKETLALLVTLTHHVTNTISSCQQVMTSARYTPRKSASGTERRESTRRLSGKSPARGVVQPMVGGHTITKPTINLSRLNIQREYRVQNAPNLSDIDEVQTTPEQSPAQPAASIRLPITRNLNCVGRRIDRLPERLQRSLRTSDESERRSSARGSRNSDRHSPRLSRNEDSDARWSEVQDSLRTPRVSLQDVSRLLQNSQSVNVRKLLETSSDFVLGQSQDGLRQLGQENITRNVSETQTAEASRDNPRNSENSENPQTPETKSPSLSESSGSDDKKKKTLSPPSTNDDPLEGPSWLLNDSQPVSVPIETVPSGRNASPRNNARENGKSHRSRASKDRCKTRSRRVPNYEPEEEEDDDDKTVNLGTRWPTNEPRFFRNLNRDDDRTETEMPNFVTRKRGSHCDDTDDFTLMWRPSAPKNYHFDINDLELPVLESPLVKPAEVRIPEREPTTNVQMVTQNLGNLTSVARRMNEEDTIIDATLMARPSLTENFNSICTSVVEQDERSEAEGDGEEEDDDEENDVLAKKRKRTHKQTHLADCSNGESDSTPTPKRKNTKGKTKERAKDPSSAKVVLQKLKDNRLTKGSSSPEIRHSQDHTRELSSESDVSSNASSRLTSSHDLPRRPRRQKAPTNLQEPSLGKKLRRN